MIIRKIKADRGGGTPTAENGTEAQKTATEGVAVRANTALFDKGILRDLNKARTSFIEFAKKHFPSSVKNAETGREIGIPRRGLDKFLSGRISVEKYASGFHIPELVERAHKVAQAKNQHTEQAGSIPTYEYYESPIEIEGIGYMAHIRVRNTLMGDKYYGHTISEVDSIEIEPSARTSASGDTQAVQPVNAIDSSGNTVPHPAQDVNPVLAAYPLTQKMGAAGQKGITRAVFVGHDHLNNAAVRYKGVDLVYSKSIDFVAYPGIAAKTDQRGATLITLHPGGTYQIDQVDYHEKAS